MAIPQIAGLALKLEQCLNCLKNLEETNLVLGTFAPKFKEFLQCLSSSLLDIQKAMSLPCNQSRKAKMWLCLSQMIKTLRLLGSFSQSRQTVWYLKERLQCCVSELSQLLVVGIDSECSEHSDSFVQLLDSAIQLLDSGGDLHLSSWKKVIHNLICQAVTIARVSLQSDCKEINYACQKLLLESNELGEGRTLSSLLTGVLSHNLNTLEHLVNVAVLRLLVEVFCEPNKPLKQLVSHCSKAPHPRNPSDLDEMVTVLDTHVERLMLVGEYTVSCCESATSKTKMKCCLASLESIDNYLVPAITAFYLEPDCLDKRSLVKVLCDHWQEEVSSLHSQVDLIIDSQALTKVIESCMKELVEFEKPSYVNTVVNQGILLQKHLSRAPDSLISKGHLKLFKEALHRCQSRVQAQETDHHTIATKTKEIIWLVEYFSEYLEKVYHSRTSADTINYSYKRRSNNSEQDYNLSKSIRNSDNESESPNKLDTLELTPCKRETDLLAPYLNQAGERSTTLYVRTPRKFVQTQLIEDKSQPEPADWDSFSVDVSEILDNLSKLADTLRSEQEISVCHQDEDKSSDLTGSWDIGLSERLQDLRNLDGKIRMLKLS